MFYILICSIRLSKGIFRLLNHKSAKLYEIGAGTSEVRRMVIGRAFNKEFAHLA